MSLPSEAAAAFRRMWSELEPLGRHPGTGGYRRYAWTREDAALREWFTAEATRRQLDLAPDRNGNLWAWWGDPSGRTDGVVTGSHLDSVPDGGAFDGPLGVVSAYAAVDALRGAGHVPDRPLGVVLFADEEGARFGVACAGSRLLTGALPPDRARALRDVDGRSLAEAMRGAGHDPERLGRDEEALRRVGTFIELHVEQGRGLVDLDEPVALASGIWPHGRWRVDLRGEANHAGTTPLDDRDDPMLRLAAMVTTARAAAQLHGCVATVGRLRVEPNASNAVPSRVQAWLDVRGEDEHAVRRVVTDVAGPEAVEPVEESWSPPVFFAAAVRDRLSDVLGGVPVLSTGAGHDAGILADAGVPTAMLFVRNPTGVSHSPAEHAEEGDCLDGVAALTAVLARATTETRAKLSGA